MSLVFLIVAVTLCVGFATLVHAMKYAPEGSEDNAGFEINVGKIGAYLETSSGLEPVPVRVDRINAA